MKYLTHKGTISLLLLVALAWVSEIQACKCPIIPPKEMYENADYVFIGVVVKKEIVYGSTTSGPDKEKIEVNLLESLEGDTSKIKYLITSVTCGTKVNVGSEYIFFTRDYEGNIWTGGCGQQAIRTGSEAENQFWKSLIEDQLLVRPSN